jgi:hypothetical protein
MGSFTDAWKSALWVRYIVGNPIYIAGITLIRHEWTGPGWVLSNFLSPILSLSLAMATYVIVLIICLIYKFIVSIVFNWQTSVVIIFLIIFLLVFAIIWGMVRTGVNQGILPAIIFLVSNVINPIIRILKMLLKLVGAKLPFDEIDEDSLSEGMPTLFSILLMVIKPLIEMLLSPLRSKRKDVSFDKCKTE